MQRTLKRLFSKILHVLPYPLKAQLVRRFLKLPQQIDSQFVFKVVDSTEELEASFRLVYQAYLKAGYCDRNQEQMRTTMYHALSSTTVMVAKLKDTEEVVGTLTLVRDNYLSLPIEKMISLKQYRTSGARLAEVTSLVIHEKYRRNSGGHILFPLMKLMYQYASQYFGVSALVVTVEPKTSFFYKALLLFDTVPDSYQPHYMGAPSETLILNLEKARADYQTIYQKYKSAQNLFQFFVQKNFEQIQFPHRNYLNITDSVVSKEYYEEVFVRRLKVILPPKDTSTYQDEVFKQRESPRFETELKGVIEVENCSYIVTVKEVSQSGLRILFESEIPKETDVILKVRIKNDGICEIKASLVWSSTDHLQGMRILAKQKSWSDFLSYLEEKNHQNVA